MQKHFLLPTSRMLHAGFFTILSLYTLQAQQPDTLTIRSLGGVEVIGQTRPAVTRQAAPLQLLDRAGIERLGVQDLSEALKRFSGVTVQDYGGIGGLKTVSVRSLGSKHTAVDYDGITVSDAQNGQIDISRFTLDNVESVALSIGQTDDIFQTARMYASAGALSIRTSRPRFEQRPFRLEGQVKTGSFGLVDPSVRYEQKLTDRYAATFQTDWMHADGQYPYTFTNGNLVTRDKRKNSDVRTWRAETNWYADWGRGGTLDLKGYWFQSRRGLPGPVILYNDYHKERLHNRNGFVQARYELPMRQAFTLRVQGKFDYARTLYRDFHSKYVDGRQTDIYTQREYYTSASLLYRPWKHVSFSLAEDFFANTLDATTPKCPFPTRYTNLTAFAAQYSDSRFTVNASLLGTYLTERLEIGQAAPDRKRVSPAVSLSYRPFAGQNLRVRLSYQDIFRSPTFNDLYYDRLGNKELDSEKATQYNAGLTWSETFPGIGLEYLSLTADGYYNRVKDKIVALPTLFIWKMMNLGVVRIFGVDVNLAARMNLPAGMHLFFGSSYTWQQAQDRTTEGSKIYGHQIPYTPEHTGTVSLSLENPWVNIGWTLTAVGDRYSLPQNIEANLIEGYTEQQLSANRTFRVGACDLRLQAEIVNLGNVTYDVIRYYPMPGRSFRCNVRITY